MYVLKEAWCSELITIRHYILITKALSLKINLKILLGEIEPVVYHLVPRIIAPLITVISEFYF